MAEGLHSHCQVSICPSQGRHIRCVQPLPRGSSVIAELPFAHVLDLQHSTQLCHNCLQPDPGQPCDACCAIAYCGPACREADRRAHTKECRSLQRVRPHVPTPTIRLLLRTLRRLEVEERQERRGSDLPSAQTRFEELVSHLDEMPKERRGDFAQLAKLVRDCRLPGEALARCDDLPALVGALARLSVNSFHLLDEDLQPVGSGLFLLAAALNHSCAPNAAVVFEGPRLLVQTTRDIAVGEEITISYVEVAASTDVRQEQLKSRYFFDCSCELCQDVERDVAVGQLAAGVDVAAPNVQRRLSAAAAAVREGDRLRREGAPASAAQYALALRHAAGLLGPRHLLRHRAEDGLAHCAVAERDFEAALEHCGRTLEGYRFLYGPAHPMVALQYAMHGKLAWFLEDAATAQSSLAVAVDIMSVTHGPTHPVAAKVRELQREVEAHGRGP
eukprot:EG_transcript_9299